MWINADVETGLFSFENYHHIMMTNRSRRGSGVFLGGGGDEDLGEMKSDNLSIQAIEIKVEKNKP